MSETDRTPEEMAGRNEGKSENTAGEGGYPTGRGRGELPGGTGGGAAAE